MDIIASRAVSVALFGGLAAFLAFGPAAAHVQILALLLGWVSYRHFNGGFDGLKKAIAHNLAGAALGAAAAVLVFSRHALHGAAIDFPAWAALGVAVTLALLVLTTKISLFGDIVGLLLGYAAIAAEAAQSANLEALLALSPENPAISVVISLLVGVLFGFGADSLADALGKLLPKSGRASTGAQA